MNEEKQLGVEEIADGELEQVAGGFVICRDPGRYEVIDDRTGDVLAAYDNKADAMRACAELGLSTAPKAFGQPERPISEGRK